MATPLTLGNVIIPIGNLVIPLTVPYSIYVDGQPWTADTNRYTVDSASTTWSADGGSSGGGSNQPLPSNNPNNKNPPQPQVPISITTTLNTKY